MEEPGYKERMSSAIVARYVSNTHQGPGLSALNRRITVEPGEANCSLEVKDAGNAGCTSYPYNVTTGRVGIVKRASTSLDDVEGMAVKTERGRVEK
jgi:hypothetical protein